MARYVCVTCKRRYRLRSPADERSLFCKLCGYALVREFFIFKLVKWTFLLGTVGGVVLRLSSRPVLSLALTYIAIVYLVVWVRRLNDKLLRTGQAILALRDILPENDRQHFERQFAYRLALVPGTPNTVSDGVLGWPPGSND